MRVEYLAGNTAGFFRSTPRGVILHGSRSGQPNYDIDKEYVATVNYVRAGAAGLGWNATIGEYKYCEHLQPATYGWNARAASPHYLAVEFAQPTINHEISVGQVMAFCAWFRTAQMHWSDLPLHFPTHAEVELSGETGQRDGKSDVYLPGARADALRRRIAQRLGGG